VSVGPVRVYERELKAMEWWQREPAPVFPNASCREVGVDVMFTDDQHPTREQRASIRGMCGRCPYQKACLDYALRVELPWGWMGGLTASERIPLIRARRAA
jgi:hypothetical protein